MGKRKRRKKNRETDSRQVELLQEEVPEAAPLEGGSVEAESATEEPVESPPGDRWVKAVGQLKPSRDAEATQRDQSISGGRPRRSPAIDRAKTPDASRHPEPEPHASARDHAAAGVRPAGEPLARARDLVERGRIHEAIELYLGILTVNPSNLKAHNNLGVLLDELKQFDAALEHFEAAERLAPENVEILANYASTLTSLARYDKAEELLRRAQRLAPDDVQVRLGIAILYFRRGLYGQAETELRWVCERDEANGVAFYYRGEALNRLGRFDEAAEAVGRAVELIPNDPRPFYTLGHLYDRRHQLEDAAEMYRRARRLQKG
jgi:tetratricopeptide (TPR) repeat protein